MIADEAGAGLPASPAVIAVGPLLRALIVEAANIEAEEDSGGMHEATEPLRRFRRARAGEHERR